MLSYTPEPPITELKNIMKKAKKWKSIRVDEETYLKLKKNADVREISLSELLKLLINKK